MVNSGHDRIAPVAFASERQPGLSVEVVRRRDLFERLGPEVLGRPERPSFDILMLVESGRGTHTIDFERITLVPARLVRVASGQVQSWDLRCDVDATLASLPAAIWVPIRSPRRRRSSKRFDASKPGSTVQRRRRV